MMVGLLGIVKRDNAFHDVFRYFGFTVENVVNIVKCRMCHILPNMPKLFHNSIVTVDFFKIKSVYICVRESDCNRVC